MATAPPVPFQWELVDDVAVARFLSRNIDNPRLAHEFEAQLDAMLEAVASKRMLLNFHKTKSMSSTTFATLLKFGQRVAEAHGQLAICALHPGLRMGADIIGLGAVAPMFDDESSALDAMAKTATPG